METESRDYGADNLMMFAEIRLIFAKEVGNYSGRDFDKALAQVCRDN
jgi:hypothetical protein